ncbi:zinc finger domain-containing protein [Streptomyces solincola]|uniref:zinc finger domain-containing protein n=1 Tax=Streptomyces solincola TaxID=2100817 RepID=UPI0011B27C26|nr:hypothetical protein [Streptomyces solincola]
MSTFDPATPATPATAEHAPALTKPALAIACPACGAEPRSLCTSHSDTRPRRHDLHRARTAAHAANG